MKLGAQRKVVFVGKLLESVSGVLDEPYSLLTPLSGVAVPALQST
jgi:hypothetical protein